ncbi:MAG: long-chain fatty acid--CoA ligase [Deltaproteobacteria bacterium]|nr:long-chain fatty acid--CoA ligase [Deltaproteobacteria bacterium]
MDIKEKEWLRKEFKRTSKKDLIEDLIEKEDHLRSLRQETLEILELYKNMGQLLRRRAFKHGSRLAVEKRLKGVWQGCTWEEYYDAAKAIGLGLYSLGVRKGDRVSLLSQNRLEWIFLDMGIMGIGACTVPIYVTLPASEVAYIISNSESKVYIAENKVALNKALEKLDECTSLKKIVVIDTEDCDMSSDMVISFEELKNLGKELESKESGLFERLTDEVEREDLATIIYTSGTTGPPKGAMITHSNIFAVLRGLGAIVPAFDTDVTVPFLPLCHVYERVAGHFTGILAGITTHYAQDFDTIVEDIQAKKPTIILAVPRVCEKVYAKILSEVKEQPEWKQKVFNWAKDIGAKVSHLKERREEIPLLLDLQYKLAYKLVYAKLRDALGGRVRWMTASGAPISREIIDFFNAAGIFVIEGYGMTECTAPTSLNTLDDYKFGTTGKPIPCNQVKIADDGEILIKGGNVIKGYWKMPDETKEAFTEDGWFKSGDIGHLDEDGYLVITDRKKDLIITAGGKNIAPQNIENLFKEDPLFEQFVVVGDMKKYLVGLVNINLEEAQRLAKEEGIQFSSPEELLDNKDFSSIVDKHVEDRNKHLARVETIKYYRIVKQPFSEETGELTPSLKVKRKVVMEKYKDVIDGMYSKEA